MNRHRFLGCLFSSLPVGGHNLEVEELLRELFSDCFTHFQRCDSALGKVIYVVHDAGPVVCYLLICLLATTAGSFSGSLLFVGPSWFAFMGRL